MTTFQAIVTGVIHGFTEFLPISSAAHHHLVPFLLGWNPPEGAMLGALALGGILALLVYFRHDWASMISSLIGVILFRKKPMTLDERLPLFILLASLPTGATWYYLRPTLIEIHWNPQVLAAILVLFGIPLWFADYFSRHKKTMSDWNTLDALVVGLAQIALLIPGCGLQTGTLTGALFRNYNREAAMKFAFYMGVPVLVGSAILHLREIDFHAASAGPDLSWLSFGMGALLAFFSGLLAIGMIMKSVQQKGFASFFFYRCFVAAAVAGMILFRSGT